MKRWILPILAVLLVAPIVAMATGTLTIPNNIGAQPGGNVSASLFDANWTAIANYVNGREITLDVAANRPVAGTHGRYFFATDTAILYVDTGSSWTQISPAVTGATAEQFTGLMISQPVTASNTVGVSSGAATSDDTTITTRILMVLGTAFTKTNASWAVGTGNGCLDTGTVAANTWYHVFLIQRLDTSVVDLLCSGSATAPTMPTNYTKKRRIGATLTDASAAFTPAFEFATGEFIWATPSALNISTANPGTSAVTATVSTPFGVNTRAYLNVALENATTANIAVIFRPISVSDVAPSATVTPLISFGMTGLATPSHQGGLVTVWTNTASQVAYRLSASGAGDVMRAVTVGWFDPVRQ